MLQDPQILQFSDTSQVWVVLTLPSSASYGTSSKRPVLQDHLHFRCKSQAQGHHTMDYFPFLPQHHPHSRICREGSQNLGKQLIYNYSFFSRRVQFRSSHMGKMHRASIRRGHKLACPLQACPCLPGPSSTEMCSPAQKLCRSHCQAFVYFSLHPLSSPHPRGEPTKKQSF